MTGAVIGALRANLSMNSAQFRRGSSEAQQSLNRLRNQFRLVSAGAVALGVTLTASVVAGLRDVDRQAKAARSIDGTTSALRAMELAAGDAGVEVGLVTSGLQKMSRELARAASEAGPARDALDGIGLSANDLLALDADERLSAIADRTRELGFSVAQTTNLLRDLGVGNTNFAKIIVAGGDAIRAARNEVREFGLELDAAGVAKVEAANDSMSRLGMGFEAFRNQLAISVAPALLDLSNGFVASLRKGGMLNTMISGLGANIGTLVSIAGTGVAVFGVRYVAAFAGMRIAANGVTLSLVQMRAALASTGVGLLVIGAGLLIAKLMGLDGASRRVQMAIDSATLAMADEIRQVQLLTAAMGPGTRMTVEAAQAKLRQAEATLANVDATRQDLILAEKQSSAYVSLQREAEQLIEVVGNARAELRDNPLTAFLTSEDIAVFEARIAEIQAQQREMVELAGGITPEYQAAAAEIARVKAAIASAKDGIVSFNGAIIVATELGGRLHDTMGGIDFSQSVRGAQQLAQELEISLSRAMQIMGLVGAAAQAKADPVIFDPRDPRFDAEAAATAARLERIRAQMEAIQNETAAATVITPRLDAAAEAAGRAGGAVGGIGAQAEDTGQALSGPLLSGVDSVSQAFGDFAARGFKDFKSFADQVKATFTQLIANLVATAAKNQILISLGLSGGAGGGGLLGTGLSLLGSGATGGGGLGGLLSGGGIATLGSGVLGGLSGVGAGIAGGFTSGGVGAAISGGFGASISGISGGLGGIGAAIGAALPVVGVGLAIAGLFGFGKKKRKPIISSEDFRAVQTGLALTKQSLKRTADEATNLGGLFGGLAQQLSTKGIQRAARDLKNLAGGAEEFTELTQGYLENFFSDAEKRSRVIEGITATFDKFNLEVPTTAAGFRELVEGFDLTTKEGRKAYVELLKVSDAFAAVYGTAQDATAALSGFYGGNIFGSLVEQRLAMAALNRGANVSLLQSGGGVISPNELVRLTETGNGIDPVMDSSRSLRDLVRYFQRWEIDGLPPERTT
ncbi:hypothetical protein [Roseobacter sp. CCS2]|uniref:hypothetical protein n=1 Tax=Roseobacter sp. CCS2 TaxID=391593 RepID=UPI0000F3C63A|nr:hypothetical protein [Roseobacter sp. CCS2]EBA11796.1 phage-related protein, probable phage tail tape meausure protein, lambda family [Roseobacter sp. CCS2]